MGTASERFFEAFRRRDAGGLLRAVLDSVSDEAAQCIVHPLGFYFIRLAADKPSTIRLHYWPATDRQSGTAVTQYHDHVWSLSSCILAGQIENILFEPVDDEDGPFQLADINQAGNIDHVVPRSSRVRIQVIQKETHSAGTFYEIPPRVFHWSHVPDDVATVTVVKATVAADGGPRTLVPVGFTGHEPPRDPILTPKTILSDITTLLKKDLDRL